MARLELLLPTDTLEYFKSRCLVNEQGCWVWQGSTTNGYGTIKRRAIRKSPIRIHIVTYYLFAGSEPIYELDHTCRNHACCNPEHLEDVTHQVNIARGYAALIGDTCPIEGHGKYEFRHQGRHRFCRTCDNEYQRKRATVRNLESLNA